MFEQNVTHGPGISTLTSHTFEIITMLLGAFLFGLWLGWMLWSKYKSMIDKYRLDNESLKATVVGLQAEIESLKSYKSTVEVEQKILLDKVTALATENNLLKFSYDDTKNRLDALSDDNMELEGKLSAATSITPEAASVPMEIVTSPFDVHVEDLVLTNDQEVVSTPSIEVEALAPIKIEQQHTPYTEEFRLNTKEPENVLPLVGLASIAIAPAVIEPQAEEAEIHEEVMESPVEIVEIHEEVLEAPVGLVEIHEEVIESPVEIVEIHEEVMETPVEIVEIHEEVMETPVEIVEIHEEVMEAPVEIVEIQAEAEKVTEEELPMFEVVQTLEGEAEAETFTQEIETKKITLENDKDNEILPSVIAAQAPVIRRVVLGSPRAFDIPDDLKVIEGIGPKIEEILHNSSIKSYNQLAATPVNRIKEILVAAGSRYAMHDPGTWPAQALLASNNEWENLKAYQTFLNAGKRPT